MPAQYCGASVGVGGGTSCRQRHPYLGQFFIVVLKHLRRGLTLLLSFRNLTRCDFNPFPPKISSVYRALVVSNAEQLPIHSLDYGNSPRIAIFLGPYFAAPNLGNVLTVGSQFACIAEFMYPT